MKKNFDRFDICMSVSKTTYEFNGKSVTATVTGKAKTPKAFQNIFGDIEVVGTATAKCHPDDTFNQELGCKIAEAKAEAKAYKLMANAINKKWAEHMDAIEGLYPMKVNFSSKATRCVKHNNKYIKFLTAENESY